MSKIPVGSLTLWSFADLVALEMHAKEMKQMFVKQMDDAVNETEDFKAIIGKRIEYWDEFIEGATREQHRRLNNILPYE